MSVKSAETKPFWMDDEEWNRKYPQMPQTNLAESVSSGIPEFEQVEKGNIVGEYTIKDGLLIYHLYKKDRKKIFDDANGELDRIRDEITDAQERSTLSADVAAKANNALHEHPWWPNFAEMIHDVLSEVFKYQPHKATFYSEVDSWSVILPAPSGIVRPSKQQLERPFSMLALRVEG